MSGPNAVTAVNAATVANVGETDVVTASTTAQHVEIIQRNGHTEVREHRSNDKES